MRAGAVTSVFVIAVLAHFGATAAAAKPVASTWSGTQVAQGVSDLVWCHDVDRALVSRKPEWKCAGRVVSDAEAQKIRDQRIRRIRGVIKRPRPLFNGLNLRGTGSGFFVTETGSILTNRHVIDQCAGISFTPAGGKALVTELIASEKSKDLALLRTPYVPAGVAPFRSAAPLGRTEEVFVIGYPLHGKVAIKPIMTSGHVVDARRGPRPGRFPMKIDVRRGNSGGPVLDRAGRIVGVVVAKVNTPSVYAATGRLVRNVGIAIRLSVVLAFMNEHSVDFQESSANSPLTDDALFSKAHQFVGQVGCWR